MSWYRFDARQDGKGEERASQLWAFDYLAAAYESRIPCVPGGVIGDTAWERAIERKSRDSDERENF